MTSSVQYHNVIGTKNKMLDAAESAKDMADAFGLNKNAAKNAAFGTVVALESTVEERKLETQEAIEAAMTSKPVTKAISGIVHQGVVDELNKLKAEGYLKN